MPRAEVGTPKFVANKMKSKGLQRLRWYCQVCEKQCRDENGFKCHTQSEAHLRQMLVVGEHAGSHIANFSSQFQSEFVGMLSRRFGTKRVAANRVYQEYIADKSHLHMNATRWVTLSEFVKHLGRTGVARVDETEKGWFIAWIDSSPKALAKAEASIKKDRATISDEARERQHIAEQIEKAKGEAPHSESPPPAIEEGLKREDTEKVVLSFSAKPVTAAAPTAFTALKVNTLKPTPNPLKANPLKRPNVFKSGPSTSSNQTDEFMNEKKRPAPISAAERLIQEEQERKRRRMDRDNGA
ncbi:domain of Kin17 curved DNA-binding protein-domain-containing protein [Crepidotus variabilis]|uniref:Domain of Kin17 curved DNA-binding protein-domain-containing protein n=1 Tax=Crepidotus variabilis TaxID=179855 RepID=A0A9P6EEP9_9AGAR|nr:domain of Kin17 curved DNA-binding protein-domain-containing protein [Crepidotus variabilis]